MNYGLCPLVHLLPGRINVWAANFDGTFTMVFSVYHLICAWGLEGRLCPLGRSMWFSTFSSPLAWALCHKLGFWLVQRWGKWGKVTTKSECITVALSLLVIQLWCVHVPGSRAATPSRVGWPGLDYTSHEDSTVSTMAATSNDSDRNSLKRKLYNFYERAHLLENWRQEWIFF